MCLEESASALNIVPAEGYRQLLGRFGNSCVDGGRTDEPVVGGEERMIGADANQVAPRIGPSEADSAGRGIRAVLTEFHHLGAADAFEELLRASHLDFGRACEVAPTVELSAV